MSPIPFVVDGQISASVQDYAKVGVELAIDALGKCYRYTFEVYKHSLHLGDGYFAVMYLKPSLGSTISLLECE